MGNYFGDRDDRAPTKHKVLTKIGIRKGNLESVGVLNHGANDSILDLPVVQVDADFVAYLKFALWFQDLVERI